MKFNKSLILVLITALGASGLGIAKAQAGQTIILASAVHRKAIVERTNGQSFWYEQCNVSNAQALLKKQSTTTQDFELSNCYQIGKSSLPDSNEFRVAFDESFSTALEDLRRRKTSTKANLGVGQTENQIVSLVSLITSSGFLTYAVHKSTGLNVGQSAASTGLIAITISVLALEAYNHIKLVNSFQHLRVLENALKDQRVLEQADQLTIEQTGQIFDVLTDAILIGMNRGFSA